MFITQEGAAPPHVPEGVGATVALPLLDAMVPALTAQRADAPRRRCSGSARLRAERRDHGAVDCRRRRAGLRVLADPEAARAVPRIRLVVERPHRARPGGRRRSRRQRRRRFLTGVSPKRTEAEDIRAASSVDQVVARQIGQDTPFPSLELATEDFTGYVGACTTGLQLRLHPTRSPGAADDAAADGDQPASCSSACSAAAARRRARRAPTAQDRSILDSVLGRGPETCSAASARAIAPGWTSISRTSARSSAGSSDRGARTAPRHRSVDAPLGVPESFEEHVGLMFDLLAARLPGRPHPRRTLMMARELSAQTYPQSASTSSITPVAPRQRPEDRQARQDQHVSTQQLFAKFLEKLQATPDGDGSLLDHSLIVLRRRDGQRQRTRAIRCRWSPWAAASEKDTGTCSLHRARRLATCG